MNTPMLYTRLVSTNGAVSLMQTDFSGLPTFGVLTAEGELLDTFTNRVEADEFYTDAQDRLRAGLPWPDPDAPAMTDIHPDCIVEWAMAKAHREEETPEQDLLPTPAEFDMAEPLHRFDR